LLTYLCAYLGFGGSDELRLVDDLFTRQAYNPLIRPVRNLTDTIDVKFGMAMIQLINVVRQQVYFSYTHSWADPRIWKGGGAHSFSSPFRDAKRPLKSS